MRGGEPPGPAELDDEYDELPHLATFRRVAELGSFTRAAGRLGVSQAAVSQRIALLERRLGASLFDRRGGGIRLNRRGDLLLDFARRILQLHGEARAAIARERTQR